MIDIKDAHLGDQYDLCEEQLRLSRKRYSIAIDAIGILIIIISTLIIWN